MVAGTLVFRIHNEQDDYASCMEIMEKLLEKENIIAGNVMLEKACVYPMVSSLRAEVIEKMAFAKNGIALKACWETTDLLKYNVLFEVTCDDDENDIVNLQFFFLLKEWFDKEICEKGHGEGKIGLHINVPLSLGAKRVNAYYFKVSEFLSYQLEEQSHWFGNYIEENDKGRVVALSLKKTGVLKKFSPLIKVSRISYEYWEQSMEAFLNRNQRVGRDWDRLIPSCVLRADKHNFSQKIVRRRKLGQEGEITNDKEISQITKQIYEIQRLMDNQKALIYQDEHARLLLMLKELFCTEGVKEARDRNELCNSAEFKEIIKNMTLLSFYILGLFEYHSALSGKEINKYAMDIGALHRVALNMRNLVEGFLQLMQNTIDHSKYGAGYFYIRIYDANDKKHLGKKYQEYMVCQGGEQESAYKTEQDNAKKATDDIYLEMQIVDYSLMNVPDKFAQNMENRAKKAPTEDKERYKNLLNQKSSLKVSTFFNPDVEEMAFWREYYDISDNVVNHYGLQLFDSIVSSYQGCFLAVSTSNYIIADEKKCVYASYAEDVCDNRGKYIPGTQYSVLLPLRYTKALEYTALNADINYTELLDESIDTFPLVLEKDALVGENNTIDERMRKIVEISDSFTRQVETETEEKVYYLNLKGIRVKKNWEILCKSIVRFIAKRQRKKNTYFAILNCSDEDMIEITRMFTIFYDKWGNSKLMEQVQIYLSGIKPENAFLFAGKNLAAVLNHAERLAIAQGVQPECINALTSMLQNRRWREESESGSVFCVVPFDLLKYGKEGILFKKILNNIMDTEICSMRTGCKITDTHVRLGSKIHLKEFYQAELFFQNNYFTTRFAHIIAGYISKRTKGKGKLVLVGYETYSEMLVYELAELLRRKYGLDTLYLIYEQKKEVDFRYIQGLSEEEEYEFIYLVPINSTLTTHNKMQAALERKRKGADVKQNVQNYAVLLFCPPEQENKEIKKTYGWSYEDDSTVKTSLVRGGEVTYFFRRDLGWEDAFECKQCFPEKKFIEEKPLVETNKASIIPMQKLELMDRDNRKEEKEMLSQVSVAENYRRLKALSKHLIYSHVERNSNHFNYYFVMEDFFKENKEKIVAWLKELHVTGRNQEKIVFNIIVAPQHYSNSGFIEEVNRHVFNNSALVLNIEVNKEFRSNITAKYSNLIQIYKNLESCSRPAEICFHYVDDTIISGATFYRAKSLIRSIFPKKTGYFVQIQIFKSVILMLNRTSAYSRLNYQETDFYAYVDLAISSMRVQEDACVLCNIVRDAEKMKEFSATQKMSQYWEKRTHHHTCKEAKEVQVATGEEQQRAEKRMFCSHHANVVLNGWDDKGTDSIRKCIITQLFDKVMELDEIFYPNMASGFDEIQKLKIRLEWEISYIKVLSRPFFSFSAENRKVMFQIMLQLLDYMLGNEQIRQECPDICNLLDDIDGAKEGMLYRERYIMFATLIKRLSDLGSTFIIRKENMKRILDYYDEVKEGDEKNSFMILYRSAVKRVTCLSGDEIKGTWLEYLLLTGEEFGNKPLVSGRNAHESNSFHQQLYVENTRVFRDAVADLTKDKRVEMDKEILECNEVSDEKTVREKFDITGSYKEIGDKYYYNNFKKIYDWNFQGEYELIDRVCSLYIYLLYGFHYYTKIESYYKELASRLQEAAAACRVQIILPDTTHDPDATHDFHVAGDSLSSMERYVAEEFKEVLLFRGEYEDDSYHIANNIGILKFECMPENRVTLEGARPFSGKVIYLCFRFSAEKGETIIRYLRNVMLFRRELINKFEEDFATNTIQQFLTAAEKSKLLSSRRASDHAYAKAQNEFLERALNDVVTWKKTISDVDKMMKSQMGYLYFMAANSVISKLFQGAIIGIYDGDENKGNIKKESLNTTVLDDVRLFDLQVYNKKAKSERDRYLPCTVEVEKGDDWERLYLYKTGEFTISAIFILLILNAYQHANYEEVEKVQVRVFIDCDENSRRKIIFQNRWNEAKTEEKIAKLKKEIEGSVYNPQQGITLWTINKFFRYLTRNSLPESGERGIEVWDSKDAGQVFFNIALPVFRKEASGDEKNSNIG